MGPCRIGVFFSLSRISACCCYCWCGRAGMVHELRTHKTYINRYSRALSVVRSHIHSSSLLTLTLDTNIIIKLCSAVQTWKASKISNNNKKKMNKRQPEHRITTTTTTRWEKKKKTEKKNKRQNTHIFIYYILFPLKWIVKMKRWELKVFVA